MSNKKLHITKLEHRAGDKLQFVAVSMLLLFSVFALEAAPRVTEDQSLVTFTLYTSPFTLHASPAEISKSLREETQRGTEEGNQLTIGNLQLPTAFCPSPCIPTLIFQLSKLHLSPFTLYPLPFTLHLSRFTLHASPAEITQSLREEAQRSSEEENPLTIGGCQPQASFPNRYWSNKHSAPFCATPIFLCAKKSQPSFGPRNSILAMQNPTVPLCAAFIFLCATKTNPQFGTSNSTSTDQIPVLEYYVISSLRLDSRLNTILPINLLVANSYIYA